MIMRPRRQSVFDDGGFVSGVIVHDNVNIEAIRNLRVNLLEEVEKLGGPMALIAFADHGARSDVVGGDR
jgi:hypothetical protein